MRLIDVAIVGGGCSGALVAAQLFRQGFVGHLAILEPRPVLDRGLAYSTGYDEHLSGGEQHHSQFRHHPGRASAQCRGCAAYVVVG